MKATTGPYQDQRACSTLHAKFAFASLIGTTIEFFDFYIYATGGGARLSRRFNFPASDPSSRHARLRWRAISRIAFFARPVGSAIFGHFGDRIGRKTTLVIALSTMGVSTVAIRRIADLQRDWLRRAPLLLALCRFGQGLGLGW